MYVQPIITGGLLETFLSTFHFLSFFLWKERVAIISKIKWRNLALLFFPSYFLKIKFIQLTATETWRKGKKKRQKRVNSVLLSVCSLFFFNWRKITEIVVLLVRRDSKNGTIVEILERLSVQRKLTLTSYICMVSYDGLAGWYTHAFSCWRLSYEWTQQSEKVRTQRRKSTEQVYVQEQET